MSALRRRSAHPPMTAAAMPLDKLDLWLQGQTGAAATNLSMLDGFVTAIVAGPVSMDPPEWICPLLGIEIDAFNHGGTPEFEAISAVAVRHNAIAETLSNAPKTFEPIFARKPNHDIDAGPWCEGFYAAMKLRLSAWAPLRNLADINHGLLLPILFHCVDDQGRPMLGPPRKGPETEQFRRTAYKDIPAVVEQMRQYWMPTRFKTRASHPGGRGSSHRLR